MTEGKKVEIERIRATPGSAQESMEQVISELVLTFQGTRLASDAPGSTLSEFVKRSKPGSVHLEWAADALPLQVEFEQGLRRFNEYWRTRLEHGGKPIRAHDRRSGAAKGRQRAILREVGMDPTAVSFLYGVSSESVEKIRGNAGRDRKSGEPTEATREELIDGERTTPKPITSRELPGDF